MVKPMKPNSNFVFPSSLKNKTEEEYIYIKTDDEKRQEENAIKKFNAKTEQLKLKDEEKAKKLALKEEIKKQKEIEKETKLKLKAEKKDETEIDTEKLKETKRKIKESEKKLEKQEKSEEANIRKIAIIHFIKDIIQKDDYLKTIENIEECFFDALNNRTHHHTSQLIIKMTTQIKKTNERWLFFSRETKLWEEKQEDQISLKIFGKILNIFEKVQYHVNDDPLLNKYVALLGDYTFRYKTLKILSGEVFDSTFEKRVDGIGTNIPLNDGTLINIFTGEQRTRTINDYYTHTINACYSNEGLIYENSKFIEKDGTNILDFFNKICCEKPDWVEYLLTLLAVYISGDYTDKSFCIFYGGTDHGKSVLIKLLTNLLNIEGSKSSFGSITEGVVVNSRENTANAHTSHLNVLKNKRLVALSEFEETQILDTKQLKRLTGNDGIATRECNDKSGEDLVNKAHIIILSNQIMRIIADNAMRNRIRVFYFDALFTDNPNINNKHEYRKDGSILQKLTNSKNLNALLYLLVHYGKKYHENKYIIVIPEEIKNKNVDFVDDSFPYSDFITDCCDIADDFKIKTTELYNAYCTYGVKPDTTDIFGTSMSARFKKYKSNGVMTYKGIKLKQKEEENLNLK